MNPIEWLKNKLKRKKPSCRIYFVSNFEANTEDSDLYVEYAKRKCDEENLNIDIIYGNKHTNIIRTAKYKVYSFIPQVILFQFLRIGNLYFLTISILQLIPEITDSNGMPTYLIPLFFIIVISMIKEFFEDLQRHKSDNEENNKKTLVFEKGILMEKTWASIKDGDVVKILAHEYFPADLVLLNCSNTKGIVNIETKNVDGESNVKHKFCIPRISKYFQDDTTAGYCRMEMISEAPNDNIFEYEGMAFLPPLQYKKDGKLMHSFHNDEDSFSAKRTKRKIQTLHLISRKNRTKEETGMASHASQIVEKNDDRVSGLGFKNLPLFDEQKAENEGENTKQKIEQDEIEKDFKGSETYRSLSKKPLLLKSLFSSKKSHIVIPVDEQENEHKKKTTHEMIPISIDNVVLRGTSLVNTKWVYGLVINTGNRTKLMRNVSTKSRQKWSRLEYVYGNHVIVLIIIQIFISIFVAIGGVLWMSQTGNSLWYLHAETKSSSLKTFFITIGAMILLFGSFIPVDLLLIWEVVRLMQGYLINWDEDMYSKKTGRHALSKAGQLLEEMGNVTHIYSDKTGTLTQNVMQLQNIGLGNNGVYGFYNFSSKDSMGKRTSGVGSNVVDNELEFVSSTEKIKYVKTDGYFDDEKGKTNKVHSRFSDSIVESKTRLSQISKKKAEVSFLHAKTCSEKKRINRFSRCKSVGDDMIEQIYTEEDFISGENDFVFFNRVMFANKIYHNQYASDQALYCLLVFSLCHSALIRNAEIDEMECDEQSGREEKEGVAKRNEKQKKGKTKNSPSEKKKLTTGGSASDDKNSIKTKNIDVENLRKRKIYDEDSGTYFTYLTKTRPQYDASSPDEMALICTSLYLGCEFVNRPDLRTIEIELTSTFAQRLILGENVYEKFLNRKEYYRENFDQFFPEVAEMEERRKSNKKKTDTDKGYNDKDLGNLALIIPLKNIFDQNKYMDKVEQENDETTKPASNGENNNRNVSSGSYGKENNSTQNMKNLSGNNLKSEECVTEKEGEQCRDKEIVPVLSFEILEVFAFDNIRKRMSIIVKNEKNEIYMLTKGADANVLKMASENQEHMLSHIRYQLTTFANSGLRTLVLGYKRLTMTDFIKIQTDRIKAKTVVTENKEEVMQKFYNEAEKDLTIVGCTGIDDKLQDDVPQVIEDLREAGITIFVLTGDKLETAINIGHSINILNKDTYNAVLIDTDPNVLLEQIHIHEKNTNAANLINADKDSKWWTSVQWENLSLDIKSDTVFDFMKSYFEPPIKNISSVNKSRYEKNESFSSILKQEKLLNSFNEFDADQELPDINKKNKMSEDVRHYSQFAITVTGEALEAISSNKLLKIKFYTLARHVSTLIACRVTPKQKSLLVKENSAFNPKGTSLAIGDGANDVGMILMANVGVGIAGKEGLQAARSSDFTISEFRYLKKLLFVHGRESLRRNSFLVYFCIFRNVSFCLCSMVLIFLTGYSAIDAWNSWTKQIINVAFTSLPVIVFVALDKQLPHSVLVNNPVLYETTPSTLWPIYPHKTMEHTIQKIRHFFASIEAVLCYPFKMFPCVQKFSDNAKSWIGKRSKPEKFRSYGTHFLVVYFLYAIWLAVIETLLILFFATGQAHNVRSEFHSVDVDFNTFSQILYTHHALAVNAVVVILTNTWFVIFYVVLVFEVVALFLFWLVVSKWHLFLDVVGAEDLHGTFENAHGSSNYYAALLMTLYVSLLPLLLLCTYQYMKKPTMEQVVAEQIRLGVFEGMRKQIVRTLAYVDDAQENKTFVNYGFAFAVEAKDAFWGIVQKAIEKIKYPLKKDDASITVQDNILKKNKTDN